MAENKAPEEKKSFWYTVASFIVNKRKAILILFIIAGIYSLININAVKVNQDITSYLPATSETRIGLTTMEEQFVTYGSARVMVCNITYEDAEAMVPKLEAIDGVKQVSFDNTEDNYEGSSALYDITVTGGDDDEVSIEAINQIEEVLSDYDLYVSTSVGETERSMASLNSDMNMILVLAILIIVAVLFISTKAYAEIPVLLITFGVAALLNKGTNFWFGEISSVTNSIAVVLQLALAIDYAIILCDRYMEEHEHMDSIEACKVALSKAIPEISSSSLTTVSGMAAMMFMHFKLGFDMGIVLVKAILFSLIAVFFLMPGIILMFSKGIDKTMHKSFVPKISFVGKLANFTKYFVPPIFVVIIIVAFYLSSNCTYLYDVNSVPSATLSESRIAKNKINETFGSTNQLVVMVPVGDYEKEAKLISLLEKEDYVSSVTGLANQAVNDDYMVTDKLTPRQFSELTDLDIEVVRVLYMAYAYSIEQYGPVVTGIDDYSVPIVDMFLFLYDQYQEGYVKLSDEMDETLTELYDKLHDGELQLKGTDYSRLVLNFNMPVEGEETYARMEDIRDIAEKLYGEGTVILVGNSTSAKDLASSFATDNIIISVLTALFVLIILFFTFQSAGLPVLLVLTIQGSIWINFTVPALQNEGIYFIAYLIVSAIQMGATIDYAIVISSRYLDLKKQMPIKDAITETLNQAFPTIFTSGTILTGAGFLIGEICSDATVAAIGIALGRGTLISIILVLFVLPQILLLGDAIIEKTALTVKLRGDQLNMTGRVVVNGLVQGEFHGRIDGEVKGVLQGELNGTVNTRLPGKYYEEDTKAEETADDNAPKLIHTAKMILVLFLAGSLALASTPIYSEAADVEAETEETSAVSDIADDAVIVNISSAEEFIAFAEECEYDAYSLNTIFNLMADISLAGEDFEGVPYFNGTFNGNNHTISGFSLRPSGSNYGFFRYVGAQGTVKDLNLSGSIIASGEAKYIGGLAGENAGTIDNVSFKGTVKGTDSVGGIVGHNRLDATVSNAVNNAIIVATNYTGGVVGYNEGTISNAENYGDVNIEELEPTMDLGGIDLGSLNLTENIANRSDMGGIAGGSTGLITDSVNYAVIGYDHTGYNVGGIAGRQSGIILNCTNNGHVKGRKDVGGIVGQAEPFVESDYLEDRVDETQAKIDDLNKTLSGISSTVSYTSSKASKYASNLNSNASESMTSLSGDLTDLTDTINEEYPEAKQYTDNINQAMDNISQIDTSGTMTPAEAQAYRENLQVISENLTQVQNSYSGTADETNEMLNSLSTEMQKSSQYDDASQMVTTINNGIQSVTKSMNTAMNQIEGIRDDISDGLSVITGDEEYISDISSVENAAILDGVINCCTNNGDVDGDINVGGIAGTMNIEYSSDPEFDFDFTESMSLVLRTTVNDVILGSINNGFVTSKKNYAGGITGLESLGLIYNCEGYGDVASDSGSYAGGIVGGSSTTVQSSWSFCNVTAESYVGGIAGDGYSVIDSVVVPGVSSEGEAVGAVIGLLEEGGSCYGNFFVNDDWNGIDNISYAGVAEPIAYKDVILMDSCPEGMRKVFVTFDLEGEHIAKKEIVYNGSLTNSYFPDIEEREGYYVVWSADKKLKCIKQNLTVEAEYVRYASTIAGSEEWENGKPIFLAVGEFYNDSVITMEETEGFSVSDNKEVSYAYSWSISSEKVKAISDIEGHFIIPEDADSAELYILTDGKWVKTKSEVDGSYLVATIPNATSFAVVSYYKPGINWQLIGIIGGGTLIVLLIIIVIIQSVKLRKKKQFINDAQ